MKIRLLLITSLLLLSSCASLFGHKTDEINIHSNDPNAKILVNGNEVGRGNATYTLARDKTALITATKKGCSDRTVSTSQEINNTTFLNLICWPCYLIDFGTGYIHEAAPTDYNVTPDCSK